MSDTCKRIVKKLFKSLVKGGATLELNFILARLTSMGTAKARNVAIIPDNIVTDITDTANYFLNDEENRKGSIIATDCQVTGNLPLNSLFAIFTVDEKRLVIKLSEDEMPADIQNYLGLE